MLQSINPADGVLVSEFALLSADEVTARLEAAATAFPLWAGENTVNRTAVLTAAADRLVADQEQHARLITEEMGKPIRAAREEVAKCEKTLRWYASHAGEFLAARQVTEDGVVRHEPLGPVLAIMPWNFPYWQVIRFAAPALAAGNVALLKHASNVPRCAIALERLFAGAGAPAGVFQTLLIDVNDVADVIAAETVAAVTLTGSERAGRAVAAKAGEHLKKCVLELGGSDPFVVLADADVASAAHVAARSRTVNNGQSCIAAKRFIIERPVFDEFLGLFTDEIRRLRVGAPMQETTDIGPLATRAIREELDSQVKRTVAAGAHVETGGRTIDGPGFYYEPTVLTRVPLNAAAAVEEVFGPVAPVFPADDIKHATVLANATRYGLGANVWTRDDRSAARMTRELQAGTVFVNGMVTSDPRFPFGGIKRSGYGRELSHEGMYEFLNIKTVRGAAAPRTARTE